MIEVDVSTPVIDHTLPEQTPLSLQAAEIAEVRWFNREDATGSL